MDVQGFKRQYTKEKVRKSDSIYSANSSDREAYKVEDPLPDSRTDMIYR